MERKRKPTSVSPLKSLSNAERCKLYREQRKQDPTYRQRERERKKKYRENRSLEGKAHDRTLCRNRMRNLRENRKAEETNTKVEKHRTRHQVIADRQRWSEAKRTYRSNLSAQKRRRIREKDRDRKRGKRRLHVSKGTSIDLNTQEGYNTSAAARKAVSRAFRHFPDDARKFNRVLQGVMQKAKKKYNWNETPTENKKLKFLENTAKAFKDVYQSLKITRLKKDIRLRKMMALHLAKMKKYRLLRQTSRDIGFRWGTLTKWSQIADSQGEREKIHKGSLPVSTVKAVNDFYLKPYISVSHAGKKSVLKRLGKQKKMMSFTLKAAHEVFQGEHPSNNISFSKFAKLRPKEVETLKNAKFRTCLCECCTNIEMMLKIVNFQLDPAFRIKDKYQASNLTLCPYEAEGQQRKQGHPRIECIKRECTECGISSLEKHLSSALRSTNQSCSYYQWENCKVYVEKANADKTRKVLVHKECGPKELIQKFLKAMENFSYHLFCATWQHRKFCDIKEGLREGHVLSVLDFAENYTMMFQDECQSAHWCKKQVTIHPVVSYYMSNQRAMVTHKMVFISDDFTHDSHMVNHINSKYIEALRSEEGLQINKITQFTDGCAGQYKSRVPFMDISCVPVDFNINFERNFFGSGHGKGPSDGCSGVVKSSVTRAVKSGSAVVRDAQEFYEFCNSTISKNSTSFRRSFHYIPSDEIVRDRPDRTTASTLPGTRKLHSVRPESKPGILKVRELTCSCDFCVYEKGQQCGVGYQYVVDSWKKVAVKNKQEFNKAQKSNSIVTAKNGPKRGNKNKTKQVKSKKTSLSCEKPSTSIPNSSNNLNQNCSTKLTEDIDVSPVQTGDPFLSAAIDDHLVEGSVPVTSLQPSPEGAKSRHSLMESSFLYAGGIEYLDTEMTLFDEITLTEANTMIGDSSAIAIGNSTTTRYNVGNYIKIGVGKEMFPAVIVETPPDMQPLPEVGLWVKYFKKISASTWSLDDKEFFVDYNDVVEELSAPVLEKSSGSRFSFKFDNF